MHRLIAFLFISMSGCAPKVASDENVYRALSAPIYSNAVFDFSQLDGRWSQVAGFSGLDAPACSPGEALFSEKGGVLRVGYSLCLSGKTVTGSGTVSPSGPGRFGISGKAGAVTDWWVLWVDEGYRTMAIGTPSGDFGFILNRGKTLPADRLAAAREVLDFNGYDTERLISYGG